MTLQVLAQSGYVVNSKLLSKPHELNALIKLFNDAQSKGITNFDDLPEDEKVRYNQMMDEKGFNKGGQVPGSGNKDTVPAMLTPGEFVMSKGAVQQYGVDTLAGMNAAAGGTNIPTIMSGKTGYSGGGLVQPVVEAGSINS